MYTVDKILYVHKDLVVIYLLDRQFNIETSDGTALALAYELLYPHARAA